MQSSSSEVFAIGKVENSLRLLPFLCPTLGSHSKRTFPPPIPHPYVQERICFPGLHWSYLSWKYLSVYTIHPESFLKDLYPVEFTLRNLIEMLPFNSMILSDNKDGCGKAIRKSLEGLEGWLSGQGHCLVLQRTYMGADTVCMSLQLQGIQ